MTLDEQLELLEAQLAPYRQAQEKQRIDDEKRRKIRALEAELSAFQRQAEHRQLKLPFGEP